MRPFRPQYFLREARRSRVRQVVGGAHRSYASSATNPEVYDLVCVGGGPAGLSLVNALRSNGSTSHLKIALIDSQDLSKISHGQHNASPTDYSNRCSSLTPASMAFLDTIGASPHLNTSRVRPYNHMNVWDGITGQHITFDWATAHGFPSLEPNPITASAISSAESKTIAYMTENSNLVSALLARSAALDASTSHPLTLYSSTKVDNVELGTQSEDPEGVDLRSWPLVTLSNGATLAARLLVGADGPNSFVRTFAGIQSRGWDYERMGVVATLELESPTAAEPESATAYQRFLPSGPAALLPLPGNYATLVWSTHPSYAARLRELNEEDAIAMVNAAFRLSSVDLEYLHTISSGQADEVAWRLQHTQFNNDLVPPQVMGIKKGSVAAFPLRMRHADTYTGERVALVGDAAHTMHPLAGQGLNSGLLDAAALARTISDAVNSGADIGDTLSLEGYNTARYAANHALLGAVDKLHKVYSWQSGPVVWGRSLGLGVVERWGGLKGLFMGGASGGA
ncbi:hypothetical protein FH972_026283 [Carpinus fangiana]|uniref:Ubiquinone biosynthesis monooxygenase COQ6, mitochondrial n=1 Tax=Carpinus fangiana TaxID=176857 RepID=A0A5N6L3I1_9ROSI|nr:hypothetical protein FH972_026283 [Carpinus fangiana]